MIRWLEFVSTSQPLTSDLQCIKQYFRVVYLNEKAFSMQTDSMAAIIMPVISLQPSGTVLLLFNTSVLAYILY